MVETTRQKIPVAIVRIPIFFLMLILDVHLMALGRWNDYLWQKVCLL